MIQDLLDLDHVIDPLNVACIALLVVTGMAFVVWLAMAYANLEPLRLEQRWSFGWVVGGWFVPVVCFWRPKQVVDDAWRSVDARRDDDGMGTPPRSILVGCWWVAWIAAFVAALTTRPGDARTVDDALSSNLGYLFRSALLVVAGVLAVFVVQRDRPRAGSTGSLGSVIHTL